MENDLLQNAVLNSVAKEDALGYDFNFEDDKTLVLAAGFGASVEATNGTATVEDGVVVYEPTKYMDSIDRSCIPRALLWERKTVRLRLSTISDSQRDPGNYGIL